MKTHRLPNESAKAYAAFTAYAEMGPQRSMRVLGRNLNKSVTLLSGWAKKFKWQKRVAQFDDEQAELKAKAEREAMEKEAAKWAKRQMALRDERYAAAEELEAKVREMARLPLVRTRSKDGKTIIEPARWTVDSMAKLAETALKLKALACGVSTDKTEHTGPDNAPLVAPQSVVIVIDDNGRD